MSVVADGRDLQLHDDWLRLFFDTSRYADFHYLWLKHNDEHGRHPVTGERIVDSSEIADDVRPLRTEVENEQLRVSWSDGSDSHFAISWLREHAYAANREAAPRPPSRLADVEVNARELEVDALVQRSLELTAKFGLAVVRGFHQRSPQEDTEPLIQAFERAGQRVIGTHFGRIEDLRPDNTTNKNTDQLGYTTSRIDLHTDQPFLDRPPRYQLLQAIVASPEGGENFIVDARAAAAYLKSLDAGDHELITTVPVRFHRKQKAFERLVVSPVISEGAQFLARFSYFTMAPHQVPFDTMKAWYRAYNHFTRIVRDERHQYRFKLEAGDFVLYDNHRMLHGRGGFSGARWLRGIYFDV
jgi:alpha-ketoglutarate-dependent taurine dioxygenase